MRWEIFDEVLDWLYFLLFALACWTHDVWGAAFAGGAILTFALWDIRDSQ